VVTARSIESPRDSTVRDSSSDVPSVGITRIRSAERWTLRTTPAARSIPNADGAPLTSPSTCPSRLCEADTEACTTGMVTATRALVARMYAFSSSLSRSFSFAACSTASDCSVVHCSGGAPPVISLIWASSSATAALLRAYPFSLMVASSVSPRPTVIPPYDTADSRKNWSYWLLPVTP
jgi:hypothetical protein